MKAHVLNSVKTIPMASDVEPEPLQGSPVKSLDPGDLVRVSHSSRALFGVVTHPPKKAVIPPHASFVLLQNGSSGFIKSNIVDVDDVLPSCPVLCIFCEVELINYPCSLLCVDCAGRSYSYGKLHEPALESK